MTNTETFWYNVTTTIDKSCKIVEQRIQNLKSGWQEIPHYIFPQQIKKNKKNHIH